MGDVRFRDVLRKISWSRNSRDSDSDGTPCRDELLKDDKMDDVDLGTELDSFYLLEKTRQRLSKWRTAAALSTAALVVVSLFWAAKWASEEVHHGQRTLIPAILSTTGKQIEFSVSDAPNVYSPANDAVEWEAVVFHNNFHEDRTQYQGPPTDEVDKAWEGLYKNVGVIKIPKSEAERLPNATLPIPGEEDGYIIGIEVYHQLHCLDTIRKALYPDRYGGDVGMTDHQKAFYWVHLEHCVDNIRQVVMCYSDISTIPWKYHERVGGEFPDAHTTHVCRNFNKLSEWMVQPERSFPQEKYQARLEAYKAGKLKFGVS